MPSVAFTAPADGRIVVLAISDYTWGYAGRELLLDITTQSSTLTSISHNVGGVSGGDTVGRQMIARRVFGNAKAGEEYTFGTTRSEGFGKTANIDLIVMWFPGS